MTTHLLETYGMPLIDGDVFVDDRLRNQVRELLAGMYPAGPFERRGVQRYPLPKLIRLQPLAADGRPRSESTIIVAGKHISETGMSFFHPQPLAHRLVKATLEKADQKSAEFVLDLDWCRFTQAGWYESGGRFVAP